MRATTALFISAAALASGAAGVAVAARDTPEVAFRKLIAGKVPGEAQSCIDTRRGNVQLRAFDNKLVYRVSQNLVYVSETAGGCEGVARGDVLVTRQFQSRLCSGDIAQTVDRVSRFPTGGCGLGPFTPYRRP